MGKSSFISQKAENKDIHFFANMSFWAGFFFQSFSIANIFNPVLIQLLIINKTGPFTFEVNIVMKLCILLTHEGSRKPGSECINFSAVSIDQL